MGQPKRISIGPARHSDLKPILGLLNSCGLPLDGLSALVPTTLVARRAASVVGSVALELYGESALLRSLAVDATARGQGLGIALTMSALQAARRYGVEDVYLLTDTAEPFFARMGFEPIERVHVPISVRGSIEFTSACPQSARVMHRQIDKGDARPKDS